MKKVLPFALLITVMLASSGAGCGGKKSGDPEPEQFNGLLGRWELKEAEVYAQDVGQSERMLGKSGEGLAFVFYADGKYDGCFLPGSEWDYSGLGGQPGSWNCTTDKPGRWALKVTKLDGKSIDDGTLTLTAPTLADPLILEKLYTGTASAGASNVTVLVGETPIKTDAGGNKSWAVYHFVKK